MSRIDVSNASFKIGHEKEFRRNKHREHKMKRDSWEKTKQYPEEEVLGIKGRKNFRMRPRNG